MGEERKSEKGKEREKERMTEIDRAAAREREIERERVKGKRLRHRQPMRNWVDTGFLDKDRCLALIPILLIISSVAMGLL